VEVGDFKEKEAWNLRKKEGIEGEGERNVWRRPKGLIEEFFARKRERSENKFR